jgi:hypothetical protein
MENEDYFKFSDDILMNLEYIYLGSAIATSCYIRQTPPEADDFELYTNNRFVFGNINANTDIKMQFAGTTNSGAFYWKEDKDYFLFSDSIVIGTNRTLDCVTNNAYFKPRRVSQSAQPTPDTNEMLVWRDTDDDKTYIVYNDTDVGVRKVEMT